LLVGASVLLMPLALLLWHVRQRRRGVVGRLASRPQLDSGAFARKYFGDTARRMELAAGLRDRLAEHLPFRLDGLLPEDRLFEDLWMHQWDHLAPGEFLREVEEDYSLQLPDPILGSGTTFREIVDHVDQRIPANHLVRGRGRHE
jgi:hypothetical protein